MPLDRLGYVEAVLWLGAQLADGLAHAHERGIVHRDLKPANVLLTDDGQPMLLDFNLADDAGPRRPPTGRRRRHAAVHGPGAHSGAFGRRRPDPVDARADVYSLGAVLFELLTGRQPFPVSIGPTASVLELMLADRRGPVPAPAAGQPGRDAGGRGDRPQVPGAGPGPAYQSAAALRDDLARQRANFPLKYAPEPSPRERVDSSGPAPAARVRPALAAYAAALLLVASAITVRLSTACAGPAAGRATRRGTIGGDPAVQGVPETGGPSQVRCRLAERDRNVLRLGTRGPETDRATEPGWETVPTVARLPDVERERLKGEIGEVAFLTARAAALLRRDADYAARLNAVAGDTLTADARPAAMAQRLELPGWLRPRSRRP